MCFRSSLHSTLNTSLNDIPDRNLKLRTKYLELRRLLDEAERYGEVQSFLKVNVAMPP